jgi:diguanylate cyclase (GGDEF)-like protein
VASSILLPTGKEREIARFSSGDFFGEMSIIEKAPRSATCATCEDSVLLSLHENDFYRIMDLYPDIAIKIMYKMLNITTQRLQNTSEFLSDMVHWGEEASRRAITDELTGVYNRRYLDDALIQHFETSRNTGRPLSLIMVDLDYFREINENYGHETGDKVILGVVEVFRQCLTKKDIIARYGGDEFTVLLPGSGAEDACAMAEKVRAGVEALTLLEGMNGPVKRVTTSQGVASYPVNGDDIKSIREAADRALYQAKEEGRNRVICAART